LLLVHVVVLSYVLFVYAFCLTQQHQHQLEAERIAHQWMMRAQYFDHYQTLFFSTRQTVIENDSASVVWAHEFDNGNREVMMMQTCVCGFLSNDKCLLEVFVFLYLSIVCCSVILYQWVITKSDVGSVTNVLESG